jgi:hypothetical protein
MTRSSPTSQFLQLRRPAELRSNSFAHDSPVKTRFRHPLSVKRDLAVYDVTYVPASAKKLHDPMALARQLRPARGSFGILFEAAQDLTSPAEIHLEQMSFGGAADRKEPPVYVYPVSFVD